MQVRTLLLGIALSVLLAGAARPAAQDLYDESVLRHLELTFQQSNWWQLLTQSYASKTYIKADLKVGGKTFKDVGVRFRGNSSYKAIGGSQKKPFKISMDAFVPGQRLLGYRTLNLNNSFRDATFTREVVCYWIFRKIMPSSKCNYVKLSINGQSWGPYINVQQINKDLLREWFRDDDGNRYRGERQPFVPRDSSALIWLGSDPNLYKKGYELKNATPANPWVDVRDLCQVLNLTAADKLPAELPKVLDVDLALRYSAGQVVVPAIDSYIGNAAHNFYLFNDGYHGRFAVLPWDLNASFGGNAWLTVQQKIRLDPFYQAGNVNRPMLNKTLGHPHWRQRFLAHIRTMLDTGYDWPAIGAKVAALQKLIEPELGKDTKRLYSMQQFKDNVVRDIQILVNNRWQWIPGLKPFVEGRRLFLLAHAEINRTVPVLSALAHAPAKPTVQDAVNVTIKAVSTATVGAATLYWRVRGPWNEVPMFDDGKHGDGKAGDGVWGGAIPAQAWGTLVEYYTGAQIAPVPSGAMAFEPRSAGRAPRSYRVDWPQKPSLVRINELLARNDNGIRDEKNEREDWLELYNAGAGTADAGGLFLTDDIAQPKKWQLPAGTKIAAGGTLLAWADGEPSDGPLHASFRLAAGGEELTLFDRDGITLLDRIVFGEQQPDISIGRLFDGFVPWVSFPVGSTPRARNDAGACGYRHYSTPEPGAHPLSLRAAGTPKIGSQAAWSLAGAPPNGVFLLVLAGAPARLPGLVPGIELLVGPPILTIVPVAADAQGTAAVGFGWPADGRLAGASLYTFAISPSPGAGSLGSNGLESRLCPR